jgi:FKBP-type peptidyl-prolyl cis-trans isomerase FklB
MARALTCVVLLALAIGAAVGADDKMTKYHKRVGAKFLAEKALLPDVYTLPSGMLFKILKKGDGEKSPKADTECDVHYKGTLKDGTTFDSSFERGSPSAFAPNQVIAGWTEALQLMREGDHWEVYIPYGMAYGENGSPPKIPGYSTLVFEMQLVKVKGDGGKPAADADAAILEKVGKAYADL